MKILQRLLPLFLLSSATAFAQLSSTITVQRNFSIPPNARSYADISAGCPAGYVALSGGVDSLASADIELTALAPLFGTKGLLTQTDGTKTTGPDGWYASVINYGNGARTVMLTVVCAPITGVNVVIRSAGVTAGAATGSGTGTLAVACPAGMVVTGGGIDVTNPEAMKLTSSSPVYGTGNAFLVDRPVGTNPAAIGWSGYVSNEGPVAGGSMKVAAICAALSNVLTIVSGPVGVAQASDNGDALLCPAGFIAIGGGLDSKDLHILIATVSTPFYNGYGYALDRPSGDYSAPAGWFANTFSHSGMNDVRNMTIGVICAQVATVPAASLVTVYEFYNTALKHYFRTSSLTEAMGIDNGSAGPGWVRTGDNLTAYAPGANFPGSDVCRFYTFGANSHFYTAFASECAGLKSPTSGWSYEGLSFHIQLPASDATCPAGTVKVYRLYNNRFAFNDSNHRFTTVFASIATLQQQGWQSEGVAFCALNYSAG